jgi:hypothetical protein
MSFVNPTEESQMLIDEIFREKIFRARATPPEQRFIEGFELHEMGIAMKRDGVRAQHPEFTPEQLDKEVSRRFASVRRVEEHSIYRPA